jgi:hypothetical protein
MQENPKLIIFKDDRLFYNDEETSITEAEQIVIDEVTTLEKNIGDYITSTPSLSVGDLEALSDTVVSTRIKVSENKIKLLDIHEYYYTANILLKGHDVCDKILEKLYNPKPQEYSRRRGRSSC